MAGSFDFESPNGDGPAIVISDSNPQAIGTAAPGTTGEVADAGHVHAHGNQLGGALHANAVASGAAGFMSGSDKAKLDGLPSSATYRKEIYSYSGGGGISNSQTNVFTYPIIGIGANTGSQLPYVALRAGSITGLMIYGGQSTSVSAGTLTLKFYKNGSFVTDCELVISSGQAATVTLPAGTYTYAAGDTLDLRYSTSGSYNGFSTAAFGLELTE